MAKSETEMHINSKDGFDALSVTFKDRTVWYEDQLFLIKHLHCTRKFKRSLPLRKRIRYVWNFLLGRNTQSDYITLTGEEMALLRDFIAQHIGEGDSTKKLIAENDELRKALECAHTKEEEHDSILSYVKEYFEAYINKTAAVGVSRLSLLLDRYMAKIRKLR